MIIYIVDSIPNEMVRTYVKTAPQTIALRPHIQIALLTFLQSLKTPETELVIEDLTKLAKSVEQLFEIKRILKIDIATSDNLNSGNASYNDLLHIINNYPTRFNQFMDYFNKLINYFLHATSLDLTQANPVFQRVSEMVRIASDFQAGRIISEAFTKTIPNLVKNINAILQAKFAENGPTIEEIDGGKRKTKRQKTNRKQKINKKQKHFSKKQKKQRNTRIVHQKLNKLAKFLLIQTPNQKFRS